MKYINTGLLLTSAQLKSVGPKKLKPNILKANEKIKELTDQLINQQNISQQAINSFERLNAEFNDYKLLHQQNEELVKKLENDKNNHFLNDFSALYTWQKCYAPLYIS